MAAPSTISGAGHLGLNFSISASTAMVPKPMATVMSAAFGIAARIDQTSRKKPSL